MLVELVNEAIAYIIVFNNNKLMVYFYFSAVNPPMCCFRAAKTSYVMLFLVKDTYYLYKYM